MSRDVSGPSLLTIVRYTGVATACLLIVILEVGVLHGQDEPVRLEQLLGDAEAGSVELLAGVTEMLPGTGSRAFVRQSKGPRNRARVEQRGDGHVSILVEIGGPNVAELVQRGSNHWAGVKLQGSGNGVSLHQSGSGNRVLLNAHGDGLGGAGTYEVRQDGVRNRTVQLRGR